MIKDQFKKGESVDLNGQTITVTNTTFPVGIPFPRMKVNQLTLSVTVKSYTSGGSVQSYLRGYRGSSQVINESMTIYYSQSSNRTSTKVLSGGKIIDGLYISYDGRQNIAKITITFNDVEMIDD